MWILALYLAAACCTVSSQPVSCIDDQCAKGYYCENTTQTCHECLRCADLKREPSPNAPESFCVESLTGCGPCIKGFVVDERDDVFGQCRAPHNREASPKLPPLVWVLIACGILIIAGLLVYLLYRSSDNIKVMSTSIRSFFDRPTEIRSGDDLPPPYNPDFNHVPNTNRSYAPPPEWETHPHEETYDPFIKRAPSSQPQDARESAGNQTARVFNQPAYHDDDPLSSPEATEEEMNDDVNEKFHRRNKNNAPISWMAQDEETVPSPWTPYEANNSNNNNTNGNHDNGNHDNGSDESNGMTSRRRAAPADENANIETDSGPSFQLALPAPTAVETTVFGPSSAKRTCVSQETSNDRICDSSAGCSSSSGGHQPSTSHNQTAYTINIINNIINNTK